MQLLAIAATACTAAHALKPMHRRAWMVGAPAAALALPTPTHAQEMTTTASGLQYYDVKVGKGDGPAKIDQTVTIDYIAWLNDFEGKEFSRFEKPIKVKLGEKVARASRGRLADMNIRAHAAVQITGEARLRRDGAIPSPGTKREASSRRTRTSIFK